MWKCNVILQHRTFNRLTELWIHACTYLYTFIHTYMHTYTYLCSYSIVISIQILALSFLPSGGDGAHQQSVQLVWVILARCVVKKSVRCHLEIEQSFRKLIWRGSVTQLLPMKNFLENGEKGAAPLHWRKGYGWPPPAVLVMAAGRLTGPRGILRNDTLHGKYKQTHLLTYRYLHPLCKFNISNKRE